MCVFVRLCEYDLKTYILNGSLFKCMIITKKSTPCNFIFSINLLLKSGLL